MDPIDLTDAEGGDPRRRIAHLEAEIEELARSLERARKVELFAKAAMAGGALWMLAGLVGMVRLDGLAVLGSIAAVIGGIVLFGSNGSTIHQTQARMQAAEAERAGLIGSIGLRVVGRSDARG